MLAYCHKKLSLLRKWITCGRPSNTKHLTASHLWISAAPLCRDAQSDRPPKWCLTITILTCWPPPLCSTGAVRYWCVPSPLHRVVWCHTIYHFLVLMVKVEVLSIIGQGRQYPSPANAASCRWGKYRILFHPLTATICETFLSGDHFGHPLLFDDPFLLGDALLPSDALEKCHSNGEGSAHNF